MMCRTDRFRLLAALTLFALVPLAWAQPPVNPTPAPEPDLGEFKTVETAITTRITKAKEKEPPQPAYLGIQVAAPAEGELVVADVAADSPAAQAGLLKGDRLLALLDQPLAKADALRELLKTQHPGDTITLRVRRGDGEADVKVVLGATSRPLTLSAQRATLGVKVGDNAGADGVKVTEVTPGSPAEKLELKVGDVLLKIASVEMTSPARLTDVLSERKPGDKVSLTYRRDQNEPVQKEATLTADKGGKGGGGPLGLGWDTRNASIWKKDVYRLAVIIIDYPDVKHNEKITTQDWEESLFSTGTYKDKKSATGQPVYGSLNDFYREVSYGRFHVEGKAFAPVLVSKKRPEYAQTAKKEALLTEAIDKLQERDGPDALKDFDGIFFMYAGARFPTQRGGLYWPHRATTTHKGQRWPYFICPEGGEKMDSISVITHEFGHMLGLPDLYARPESPGSEGLGVWCLMSNQIGNGKPQHPSAWCKEQLGWLEPAVIDPTVKQKLILRSVQHSSKECYKVLVRPDGSEYFLLENRIKQGCDRELPAEGLLIWRVADGRPLLEESHGIAGPPGPRVFLGSVPFPSKSNNAFTPYTTPSSRSPHGGGLPVHLTNIQRLPDGRITFYVGYEYY
jgi:M6 family metalloprotease-like protein